MEYLGNDRYCDIILKKLVPIQIEHESDSVLAFHHTRPGHPVHIVVIPKKHILSLAELDELDPEDQREIIGTVSKMAKMVRDRYGASRVITNLGDYQDSKHLHFHVISDRQH